MSNILCIETATVICSVALFKEQELYTILESEIENTHSQSLTLFVSDILKKGNIQPDKLDYIAVSSGPGSYTGLRIGVSVAKGLCYGANKPLVMVPTTEIIAEGCLDKHKVGDDDYICAMIDARRMEVYQALYDNKLNLLNDITPHIITKESYETELNKHRIYFCGNGAFKLTGVIDHKNATVDSEVKLSAKHMLQPALKRIKTNNFADLAYDVPLYLKEFMVKPSKPYFA